MVMAYANREGGDVWMNRRGSKERESRKEKEKSFLKMVTIGIMDSCLKQINCVCLSFPLESCL